MNKAIGAAMVVFVCGTSSVALAERPWHGMKPCAVGGYVYAAGQYTTANDPKDDLQINAIGVVTMDLAVVLAKQRREAVTKVRFDNLELVDAYVAKTGQWALLRTSDERFTSLGLPACTVDVSPAPPAKGCLKGAYPHTEMRGGKVTVVVGGKRADRERLQVLANMLVMSTIGTEVTIERKGDRFSKGARGVLVPGQSEAVFESWKCGGAEWVRGIFKR